VNNYPLPLIIPKMHSRCFGIMGGHGNFAFNLVEKLSVELGYVFLSLRLQIASMSTQCLVDFTSLQ
jgi:hypothetical protein